MIEGIKVCDCLTGTCYRILYWMRVYEGEKVVGFLPVWKE